MTAPIQAGFDPQSQALKGALWMVVVGVGFAIVPAAVRYLHDSLHVFEIIFLRNLVALLPVLPVVLRSGWGVLKTQQLGHHMIRAGFNYLAMLTYFWGIQVVLLADAVSIQFLIPVFTGVAAAFLLRERVGMARWGACAAGFIGAMIIVRPGFQSVGPHTLAVLASALFYTGAWVMVKFLTRGDGATVIVFYLNLFLLLLSAVPAIFVWTTPTWHDLPGIIALGIGGWMAHYAQARAFTLADVSAMAPLDFLRLPFVVLFGYVLFDQVSDIWTWAGALVIVGAATYLTRVETRTGKRAGKP